MIERHLGEFELGLLAGGPEVCPGQQRDIRWEAEGPWPCAEVVDQDDCPQAR